MSLAEKIDHEFRVLTSLIKSLIDEIRDTNNEIRNWIDFPKLKSMIKRSLLLVIYLTRDEINAVIMSSGRIHPTLCLSLRVCRRQAWQSRIDPEIRK